MKLNLFGVFLTLLRLVILLLLRWHGLELLLNSVMMLVKQEREPCHLRQTNQTLQGQTGSRSRPVAPIERSENDVSIECEITLRCYLSLTNACDEFLDDALL